MFRIISFCLLLVGLLSVTLSWARQIFTDNPIRETNLAQPDPEPDAPVPLNSLKTVKVPGPPDKILNQFIKDKKAAIQLGKALFWDTQVGSDNKMACASCHFNAGADTRTRNQLNPGTLAGDTHFDFGGPNYNVVRTDFPTTTNEVLSSQGVIAALFQSPGLNGAPDNCSVEADPIFHDFDSRGNRFNTRQVEPRHSPSVINAVFNFRNFWDGRANNMFNGVDPFGLRNPRSFVWISEKGRLRKVKIAIPTSSLASQASGPPTNSLEMSCRQRLFVHIARKMLESNILRNQQIAPTDSVLGEFAKARPQYKHLIERAFRPEFYRSTKPIHYTQETQTIGSMQIGRRLDFTAQEINMTVTQMEANFSLFFSLAIQLYESTLVSDDTPVDKWLEGETTALTSQQQRGFEIFNNKGKCINCHQGAELTAASVSNVLNERLEKMIMGNGKVAVYDNGFYNIGVRPTREDPGVGGVDPFGNPLSETLMVKQGKSHLLGNGFNSRRNPRPHEINRVAVNGAFKTPGLRNVELTGPYFHNGGKSTLMQVVNFYNQGGDFAQENQDDLDPDIQPLGLSEDEKKDLVAFLIGLTDERVRRKQAPFDHPSICIPHGHQNNGEDRTFCLPAVGEEGVNEAQKLRPFLGLSPFADQK